MSENLRFGILSYVNCLPATLALELGHVADPRLQKSFGSPSQLNAMMSKGELDVSLVSTAEFLDRRALYQRLPDYSLWCDGWVESVTLYSPFAKDAFRTLNPTFAVTPDTATSVALLEILVPNATTVTFESVEAAERGIKDGTYQGVLLIGDRSLSPPAWTDNLMAHDLGQWWSERTSLPMTYALWVARADLDAERLKLANDLLGRSREWGLELPAELLAEGERRSGVGQERLRAYFQRLQYKSCARSAEGLVEFGGRLALHRLMGQSPMLAQR